MSQSFSLSNLLQKAIADLREAGISTPELDARLFLEETLKKDKAFILLNSDYCLTVKKHDTFQAFIARRLSREPLAKIIGMKEFWSLSFKTTQDTLDPRPDSETLIEAVLKQYPNKEKNYRILDLGTGTGCLLLSLLSEYPQATGVGVDLSKKALDVAQYNIDHLGFSSRAHLIQSNWTKNIEETFDIIISNPPYIPLDHKKNLGPELSFDPEEALYGFQDHGQDFGDGLSAYTLLSKTLKKNLSPHGEIFLEFGKDQHKDVEKIMGKQKFQHLSWHKDLSGIIRCGVFA